MKPFVESFLLRQALLVAVIIWRGLGPAVADDGHDHGASPAVVSAPALPRINAVSERFELVGVLSDRTLTLYLDRFDDNSPVLQASIQLEIGSETHEAAARADGSYEVNLRTAPAPGLLPVTVTINAGGATDLLVGELDLHAAEPAPQVARSIASKRNLTIAAGAGVAALLFLGWRIRRHRTPAGAPTEAA